MKERLKKLAKEFDLKFNKNWFNLIWISKKDEILIEYIWMCPDPVYMKYGTTPHERAQNIKNFIDSDDFKECIKRFGGQVINKDTFKKYFPKWVSEIENLELKNIYFQLYNKILGKLNKYSRIALLTKSNKESEIVKLKNFVLFHEWIHILINENNLSFHRHIKDGWRYNEGLVTYFLESYEGKLDKLEDSIKATPYDYQKQYYIYAIKFRDLLKDISNPKKRREKIINLRKHLSK